VRPEGGPAETETIRGVLERVTYVNDENGYSVFKIRSPGEADSFAAVGISAPLVPGEEVELCGRWVDHARFGAQFQFETCRALLPSTIDGIRKYLCSGLVKGIGPEMAERIIDKFRESSLDVLDSDPDALLEVRGIGQKTLDSIKQSWEVQRGVSAVIRFLQSNGIGAGYAAKIFREYGADSISVMRENPYRLADDVFGIGFQTADKFAMGMGVERDSPARLDAGVRYAMGELTGKGHVCVPRNMLAERSGELLGVSGEAADAAIGRALDARTLAGETIEPDGKPVEAVYLPMYYVYEAKCAKMLAALTRPSPEDDIARGLSGMDADTAADWARRVMKISLSDKQTEALRMALTSKALVITGGPGTGKTTLISAIIGALAERGLKINLAAPTGRAAKRMAEATGREALTLHRLLESDGYSFGRDEDSPLGCDVLIVDEASMVDVHMMYRVLCAMPRGGRLIMVGDVHQLPSVGPGNVLSDVISSGVVPVAELNVIFRQARDSGIIVNAHRVNSGLMPEDGEGGGSGLRDFYIVAQDDPSRCVDIILTLVKERIPQRFGLDPVEDVQVLTPMHKGLLGASNLNTVLRGELNAGEGNSITAGRRVFKSGDKVMQIRNDYEKEVYNGDIGMVRSVDPAARLVTVEFDAAEVCYGAEELDELVHAYAVSIHKSQGSEYPAVVMPVHTQHYVLLQRNLLYTGITRAKELVVLVGARRAIEIAVKNANTRERLTYLAQRLRSAMGVM
jgi:exodeoxyribonuclease V alpha subunit